MAGSILDNVKKMLGLDPSYTAFDVDVMMHVNAIFTVLSGLGIGPIGGFMIEDNTPTWDAFLAETDENIHLVKSYMYVRVRLLFDPPSTSMAIDAMTSQYKEFEWRLNVKREGESWTDPNPPTPPPPTDPCWWGTY